MPPYFFSLRVVAVTHFEPAHARQAFPCFDEPSLKATFTVIIIHEPAYYAVSNMPRARELERYDGLVEDHFAPSVKMSTYLVAFAVIDFDHKETISKSGVKVRTGQAICPTNLLCTNPQDSSRKYNCTANTWPRHSLGHVTRAN